jgi:SpoIID/LytB domain protein
MPERRVAGRMRAVLRRVVGPFPPASVAVRARRALLAPVLLLTGLAPVLVVGGEVLVPAPASAVDGDTAVTGPVRFELTDGGLLTLDGGRRYLDTIELRAQGDATVAVNELSLDDYVAGVAEMPSRWPLEALKAQAVAARTYAWYSLRLGSFDGYDLCATVACQVFEGADPVIAEATGERWRTAVDATAGQVLLQDGEPILARYFSTSGGRTFANEEAFPAEGPRPYLVAIDDPDDEVSPFHRWTATFTRAEWDEILAEGDTLSAAVPVVAVERLGDVDDPGARIRITGEDGTLVEVGARELREFVSRIAPQRFPDRFPGPRSDGLRPLPSTVPSSRFAPELDADTVVLHGRGWGHGVGLGQYGARGRAERGESYEDILAAYYGGLAPTTSPEVPDRVRVGFEVPDRLTVVADHPVRIVAGDELVVERTFGAVEVTRDGDGFRLTLPPPDPTPLEVAPTRTEDPAPDGDRLVVASELTTTALLRLEVADAQGEPVVAQELGVAEPGEVTATWALTDAAGEVVDPGAYRVALVGENRAGSRAGSPVEVEVTAEAAAAAERALAAARAEERARLAATETPTAGVIDVIRTVVVGVAWVVALVLVGAVLLALVVGARRRRQA